MGRRQSRLGRVQLQKKLQPSVPLLYPPASAINTPTQIAFFPKGITPAGHSFLFGFELNFSLWITSNEKYVLDQKKLSLIVAWYSSVSISYSKVLSSIGHLVWFFDCRNSIVYGGSSWCPCKSSSDQRMTFLLNQSVGRLVPKFLG